MLILRIIFAVGKTIFMKDLNYYIDCFSSLSTMKKLGKPAPHKALLLLSVIDLVEQGVITDCRIPLSDCLDKRFKYNTKKLLGESILFQPKINYPYFHMRSESFWQLVPVGNRPISIVSNFSLSNLRKQIAFAAIDEELFELLKSPNVRAKLRVVLISTYLDNQPTLADSLPTVLFALGCFTTLVA